MFEAMSEADLEKLKQFIFATLHSFWCAILQTPSTLNKVYFHHLAVDPYLLAYYSASSTLLKVSLAYLYRFISCQYQADYLYRKAFLIT